MSSRLAAVRRAALDAAVALDKVGDEARELGLTAHEEQARTLAYKARCMWGELCKTEEPKGASE